MKFSIRDMFLVTVIVALAVATYLAQIDRQRLSKENDGFRKEVDHLKRVLSMVIEEAASETVKKPENPGKLSGFLPWSSAPVPIPPKNQSGPDSDR
ncbi:MAG: hypothetical protein ACKVP0_02200 [Pirellulaceae bacterium]